MTRLTDLVLAAGIMCPFIIVYLCGVLVRVRRENISRPKNKRVTLTITLVGEAMPGMFESIVTLAAVFGVVFQSPDQTPLFQLVGLIASAAFLAFRGGYTYQESLLSLKHPQPRREPAGP